MHCHSVRNIVALLSMLQATGLLFQAPLESMASLAVRTSGSPRILVKSVRLFRVSKTIAPTVCQKVFAKYSISVVLHDTGPGDHCMDSLYIEEQECQPPKPTWSRPSNAAYFMLAYLALGTAIRRHQRASHPEAQAKGACHRWFFRKSMSVWSDAASWSSAVPSTPAPDNRAGGRNCGFPRRNFGKC